MRIISPANLYALTEKTQSTVAVQAGRGEIAFAFGLRQRLAGGHPLDLDAVAFVLVDELTAAFGRKIASTIVITHSDKWLLGLGRVDNTREPVFLAVNEYGEASRHKYFDKRALRDKMSVGVTTVVEHCRGLQAGFADRPDIRIPDRITWINLSSILKRIRERAAKLALDLSAPFFPPETDPHARKLLQIAKKDRKKALAWFAVQKLAAPSTETRP